ncbi:putative anti-sigmaE protein [Marinibacterium anthonyi]|nr:putative anti-sigmaE protein [Marinibacterium anthonyi]
MKEEMEFDDDTMLAAEFALGLLSGAELAEAQRRVSEDPVFAAEVTRWEIELSEMAVELTPEPVPRGAQAALEARLFGAPEGAAGAVPRRVLAALAFWRAISIVAVLAVAMLGYLLVTDRPAPEPLRAAEIVSDDGGFRFLAVLDEGAGVLQVTRVAGDAPSGRVLQVWAHGPDQPAVSVGLFGDGDTARLHLPLALRGVQGTFTMGISEEPPGGSQQDGPSGNVMGRGEIRL